MICPHCAFPNDPGARVCVKCRRPLAADQDKPQGQKKPGWLRAPVTIPPASTSKSKPSAGPMTEKVAACLEDSRRKEEEGDLRSAFLGCQSLLIDHYGDIPDDDMASLYTCMSRISLKQDKKERALKYLKKARTLRPKDPQIQQLFSELTKGDIGATPIEKAIMAESTRAAEPSKPPPLPPADDMPTPDETDEQDFFIKEKISKPPPEEEPEEAAPAAKEEVEAREEPAEEPAPASGRLAWVAGFWTRLLAFLIDTMVVTVVVVAMMFISSLVLGNSALEAFDFFFQQFSTLLAAISVYVLLLLVYVTLFTIFGGQTAGKMLLGLRVVGLDGHSVSYIQALRRAGGMLVAGLPGLAGFLWTAFDLKRRGWHDHIGGTLVVYVNPREMRKALSQG